MDLRRMNIKFCCLAAMITEKQTKPSKKSKKIQPFSFLKIEWNHFGGELF